MKSRTTGYLALAFLAVSALAASAAEKGVTYGLDVYFDAPPSYVDVTGIPSFTTNTDGWSYADGVAYTDGTGKLDGVYRLTATNLNSYATNDLIVDVSGSITSTGKKGSLKPLVKLTLKGAGYAAQTNGDADVASLNLAFISTNGIVTNTSSVGPLTNVALIYLNSDGTPYSTNYSTYTAYVQTNQQTAYQELDFQVHYADFGSPELVAGTNYYSPYNQVSTISYNFGTPVTTSLSNTISIGGSNFVTYPTYVTITTYASGVPSTNYSTYAIRTNDLPAVLAALNYTTTNADGTVAVRQLVASIVTNSTDASIYGSAYQGETYSSSWMQIPGTLKGTLKSGKTSQKVNSTATLDLLSGSHYVYTLVSTTGGTNVVSQLPVNSLSGSSFNLYTLNYLGGDVVQYAKNFSLRTYTYSDEAAVKVEKAANYDYDLTFSGSGSLTAKNNKATTFKGSLKGVTYSRGSSLSISGTNTTGISTRVLTNLYSFTNIANTASWTVFTNSYGYTDTFSRYDLLSTNVVGTNVYRNTSYFYNISVPGLNATNYITNLIDTLTVSGKVYGQTIPLTTGYNEGDFIGNVK